MASMLLFPAQLTVRGVGRHGELRCTARVVAFKPDPAEVRQGVRQVAVERHQIRDIRIAGRSRNPFDGRGRWRRVRIVTDERHYLLGVAEPEDVVRSLRGLLAL